MLVDVYLWTGLSHKHRVTDLKHPFRPLFQLPVQCPGSCCEWGRAPTATIVSPRHGSDSLMSYWASASTLYATTMFTNQGKLGEKRRDNYIFIITSINFRLMTCTARKTSIRAPDFNFQWSSCYRTTNTFCISISSGNPIPRNKFTNWATGWAGFPDLLSCHCIRKSMLWLRATPASSLPSLRGSWCWECPDFKKLQKFGQ